MTGMPSKSKSQQRLFGMALAVRKGELKRSEVGKEVLDIVDGDISTSDIEKFAKSRTSDRERVSEGQDADPKLDRTKDASEIRNRVGGNRILPKEGRTPIEEYLKNIRYAGRMRPIITVTPEKKYVFIVIKPGFSGISKDVIDMFDKEGFTLYKTRTKMLSLREARQLYKVHKDEDFYSDLCEYMSSDYSIGILLEYPLDWNDKETFGKVGKIKDEVREKYGESDMRNAMHSSDSIQNMRFECSMYFNELF